MIEKARSNQADPEMQGILSKWETANQRILEAYPVDRDTDMSILETAFEEAHKPKVRKEKAA